MASGRSFASILEEVFSLCKDLSEEHHREIAQFKAKLEAADPCVESINTGVPRVEVPVAQTATPGSVEEPAPSQASPPTLVENFVKAWQSDAGPKRQLRWPAGGGAKADNLRLLASVDGEAGIKKDPPPQQIKGTSSKPHHWKTLNLSLKKQSILEALQDRAHQVKRLSPEMMFKVREIWNKDDETLLGIKRKAGEEHERAPRCTFWKSDDGHAPWDWFMLHPQSITRLVWDLAGILWLSYDVVMLPAHVFPLPQSLFFLVADILGNLFWTADIGVSFITGSYSRSAPVMNFKAVARRYIRSWLVFDTFLVLIGWGSVAADSIAHVAPLEVARAARTARFLRILRYLRLARLLRVVKSIQIVDDLQARANREGTLFFVGVLKLVAAVVFMSHILACCWYGIGNVPNGWVRTEIRHNETGIDELGVGDQYLYTYQWSLSRLHPSTIEKNLQLRTTNERIFAVLGGLCAMVVGAGIISVVTNMMREFQEKNKRRKQNLSLVQAYVAKYAISPPLAVRAKRYIECEYEAKLRSQREAELMTILPHDLVLDFRYEAFSPAMNKHDFFSEIHGKHLRTHYDLCHQALSAETTLGGEIVFTTGDAGVTMRFITSGVFDYALGMVERSESGDKQSSLSDEDESQRVKVGTALSEAVLWTPWEHRGKLYAKTNGAVLSVLADDFADVMKRHEQAHVDAIIHARCFIEELNSIPVKELSDMPRNLGSGDIDEIPSNDGGGGVLIRMSIKKTSQDSAQSRKSRVSVAKQYPPGFHDDCDDI